MGQSAWTNLTDRQITALMGIISEPTGYEVDYPGSVGEPCHIKHFSGVIWTIVEDGTVGQTTEHV